MWAGGWRFWDGYGRCPGGRRTLCECSGVGGGRRVSLGWGVSIKEQGQEATKEVGKSEVEEFLNNGYRTISNIS